MSLFITGTDTNVGKTLVSSWLCLHTRSAYFKPIQTGMQDDRDAHTVAAIAGVAFHPEVYTYTDPVSPHLAAQRENRPIVLSNISVPCKNALVIEGAGGVYVPLNEHHTMMNLMVHIGAPTVLVARGSLGTINHTLLSLAALRAHHIDVVGVVISGDDILDNTHAIQHYGNVRVLAHIPTCASSDTDGLRDHLRCIPCPEIVYNYLGETSQ